MNYMGWIAAEVLVPGNALLLKYRMIKRPFGKGFRKRIGVSGDVVRPVPSRRALRLGPRRFSALRITLEKNVRRRKTAG